MIPPHNDPQHTPPEPARPIPAPLSASLAVPLAAGAAALLPSGAGASIYYLNFSGTVVEDAIPDDGTDAVFDVDANGDGSPDLQLRSRIDALRGNSAEIRGGPDQPIGIIATTNGPYFYPARLAANASIGPSALFLDFSAGRAGSLAVNSGYPGSQWADPDAAGFLGLRFTFSGRTHYGWARLSVAPNDGPAPRAITLHDLAWHESPDTWIPAGYVPEPSTPSLLALGLSGLTTLRRKNRKAQTP